MWIRIDRIRIWIRIQFRIRIRKWMQMRPDLYPHPWSIYLSIYWSYLFINNMKRYIKNRTWGCNCSTKIKIFCKANVLLFHLELFYWNERKSKPMILAVFRILLWTAKNLPVFGKRILQCVCFFFSRLMTNLKYKVKFRRAPQGKNIALHG